MGGSAASEIPLLSSFLYLFGEAGPGLRSIVLALSSPAWRGGDPHRRQCQAGSLTGAVHLSNSNAGVLRQAQ